MPPERSQGAACICGAVRGGTHRSPASPRGALATSPGLPAELRALLNTVGCARRPSAYFAPLFGRRDRLARLVQLGVRQSRYFGRAKTRFQLLMAATVANLTLVATKMGMIGSWRWWGRLQAPLTINRTSKPQGRPSLLPNSYWPQPTGSLLASDLQSTGYPPRHPVTAGLFSRVSRSTR